MVEVHLVSKRFFPIFSGAAERFRRYAIGLHERGIRLQVTTVWQPETSSYEVINGIPVSRISLGEKTNDISAELLRKTSEKFKETGKWPDVVHLLNHSLRGNRDVRCIRAIGIPVLFSLTMIPIEPTMLRQRVKTRIYQWLRYQSFTSVITSSGVVTNKLVEMGIPKKKIECIPNGVDLRRFCPAVSFKERNEIRRKLGLNVYDEVILFVGIVSHRKGVDLLVASWPEIVHKRPRSKLIIVGPRDKTKKSPTSSCYDQNFIDIIERKIAESPSPDQVVFTNEVPNVEMYMKAADVFVFPSRREGMGNVVAEAMATGLPCVVTPYDGLPTEFGKPGREYFLTHHNANALAKMTLKILDDPTRSKIVGEMARKWAEKHLDVEMSLDRLAEIYMTISSHQRVV